MLLTEKCKSSKFAKDNGEYSMKIFALNYRRTTWILFTSVLFVTLVLGPTNRCFAKGMDPIDFMKLCQSGTVQVVESAIREGADVNAHDRWGFTVLMRTVQKNLDPKVAATLLNAGADVNARNEDGTTALMWAALWNNNAEVIATLIQAGADARARNNIGNSALSLTKDPKVRNMLSQAVIRTLKSANHSSAKGLGTNDFLALCEAGTPGAIEAAIRVKRRGKRSQC
jgi:hypothetical protein